MMISLAIRRKRMSATRSLPDEGAHCNRETSADQSHFGSLAVQRGTAARDPWLCAPAFAGFALIGVISVLYLLRCCRARLEREALQYAASIIGTTVDITLCSVLGIS